MIPTLEDLDLNERATFIRVDFNVPLTPEGEISDDTRIRAALPTIEFAASQNARIVLASHLGRPKGQRQSKFSLAPVAARLAEILGRDIILADDCVGDGVKKNIKDLRAGDILLLENLRFNPGEEKNDENFARALAENIDVYVNDAFGTAHRAHASTVGMVRFVREKGAGRLMHKELEHLGSILRAPEKPFVAIVGGAKVSDKLAVLNSLVEHADAILIGGAMAYTLLKANGFGVGKSRIEAEMLTAAERVIKSAAARGVRLHLPEDHRVADNFDANETAKIVETIGDNAMGLDIGPKTEARFRSVILEAKTIFWNGPMGVFEWDNFAQGTTAVAQAVADSKGASVIGGGDSVSALKRNKLEAHVTHVSTGGGASLEFIEGKKLPGVEALETEKS